MAGKFRGNVGKLSKPKVAASTKKSRAKKSIAMVKRSPKLPHENALARIALLTGGGDSKKEKEELSPSLSSSSSPLIRKNRKEQRAMLGARATVLEKRMGKGAMEVVQARGITAEEDEGDHSSSSEGEEASSSRTPVRPQRVVERVMPTVTVADAAAARSTVEAVGLRLLHQAIKNRGHNRLLPFQQRHDYEYRLRQVGTMGVVQLFRSLAEARRAGQELGEKLATRGAGGGEEGSDDRERGGLPMTDDKARERKEMVSKEVFLAALRRGTRGR